ncbi:TAXI family TRAP transporter solute-binding subunit [Alsobacter sp. KACC 23698]|uniref:TAXI family TRAP transporter solute-binding subunit n=1 Tax=Alsobacter sp. KACC 23698 TaxID=3149229 RepID=A0AAU7JJ85_9HYPH
MTRHALIAWAAFACLCLSAADAALAQGGPSGRAPPPEGEAAIAQRMNANTVTVISGTPGGTYFRMASDLAFALDDGDALRILPVLGKGAGQNAYDVRFLRGIDLAFVRTDTLDQLRQDPRLRNIESHIAYVARLFNDELHVIASRDITDYRQLEGKKVSFDVKGSGSDYTGRAMFDGLGLKVEAVNVDQPTALKLLAAGEIAALVSVAAKPVAVLTSITDAERYHFLEMPYTEPLMKNYFPARLTHDDYPRLVAAGESVNTAAVGTILASYAWPERSDRYRRIARFVDAFFSKIDALQQPQRHPKWNEVNLEASVAGWSRFPAAQEWLDAHRGGGAVSAATRQALRRDLRDRAPDLRPGERDRLLDEFMRWRASRQ